METGLPTGSIMKYNFVLTLLLLVKLTLSFDIIMQAIPIQCRSCLKEVTLINHSNDGFAILLIKLSP